jgi:hypothetical protein
MTEKKTYPVRAVPIVPHESPRDAGVIVVAAAVMLVAVLAMGALVTDAGVMLMGRTDVSMAVDAAALAGAQVLPDQGLAEIVALEYLELNLTRLLYPEGTEIVSFPDANVIRVQAQMGLPALLSRVVGVTDLGVGAIAEATRFDPDVALIIDRSESMCWDTNGPNTECPAVGPWEPFNTIQSTAKEFVDQMAGDPTFTLLSFATDARVDVATTRNRALIKSAIDSLQPDGYTDTAASIEAAVSALLSILGPSPKLIVLLTDGYPTVHNGEFVGPDDPRPGEDLRAAAEAAFDQEVIINGINYGANVDNALMSDVAEITEGAFYQAPDSTTLQLVFDDIAAQAFVRLTFVD